MVRWHDGQAMMLSWFGFFRGDPLLDSTTLDAAAAMLRGLDGMRQGFVLSRTPDRTAHTVPGQRAGARPGAGSFSSTRSRHWRPPSPPTVLWAACRYRWRMAVR